MHDGVFRSVLNVCSIFLTLLELTLIGNYIYMLIHHILNYKCYVPRSFYLPIKFHKNHFKLLKIALCVIHNYYVHNEFMWTAKYSVWPLAIQLMMGQQLLIYQPKVSLPFISNENSRNYRPHSQIKISLASIILLCLNYFVDC